MYKMPDEKIIDIFSGNDVDPAVPIPVKGFKRLKLLALEFREEVPGQKLGDFHLRRRACYEAEPSPASPFFLALAALAFNSALSEASFVFSIASAFTVAGATTLPFFLRCLVLPDDPMTIFPLFDFLSPFPIIRFVFF
jgi:hypothetical protein